MKKYFVLLMALMLTIPTALPSLASETYDKIQISNEQIEIVNSSSFSQSLNTVRIRASLFFTSHMTQVSDGYTQLCFENNGKKLNSPLMNPGALGRWDLEQSCIANQNDTVFSGMHEIDVSFPMSEFSVGRNHVTMKAVSPENIPFSIGNDNIYDFEITLPEEAFTAACLPIGARAGKANVGDTLRVDTASVAKVVWRLANLDVQSSGLGNIELMPEMIFLDLYPHCFLIATGRLENGQSLTTDPSVQSLGSLSVVGPKTFITEPTRLLFPTSSVRAIRKWKTQTFVIETLSIGWTPPKYLTVRTKIDGKWGSWKKLARKSGKFRHSVFVRKSIQFQFKFNDENGVSTQLSKRYTAR